MEPNKPADVDVDIGVDAKALIFDSVATDE
jgi:hypothetical protein